MITALCLYPILTFILGVAYGTSIERKGGKSK
jgi:hypothetical protein